MNLELLKQFKRKIPLRNELEDKYSGGDPANKSNWVNQKDYRSSVDQKNINKAYCFYSYKFTMNMYEPSELEWLISKGFLGYDEVAKHPKLLDWLLKYINPETDEERDARIIEVSKNLRKMVQLPFNKLNKYE
jgi:hypothetical protein